MSLTDNPDGPNVAVTGGAMPAADLSQTAMSSANNNALTSNLHTPESQAVADALIDTSQQEAPPPDHAPPEDFIQTDDASALLAEDAEARAAERAAVKPDVPPPDGDPATRGPAADQPDDTRATDAAAAQNPDVAEHLTDNIKVEPETPCSPPPSELPPDPYQAPEPAAVSLTLPDNNGPATSPPETILEMVEDEAKVIIEDVEAVVADVVHDVEHLATEAKEVWDSHQQKNVTPPTT